MNDEIRIPLPNGDQLVARINDCHPAQIFIELQDQDNQWVQDFALVEAVSDETGIIPDKFNLLLWEDEGDECYTHQAYVNRYKIE